jgi:hypothetical protein
VAGVLINTWLARLLPNIEIHVLAVHVIGFFCALIPLVYLALHGFSADLLTLTAEGIEGTDVFIPLSMTSSVVVDSSLEFRSGNRVHIMY